MHYSCFECVHAVYKNMLQGLFKTQPASMELRPGLGAGLSLENRT